MRPLNFTEYLNLPRPPRPQQWGPWYYDADRFSIAHKTEANEVWLDQCTNARAVLYEIEWCWLRYATEDPLTAGQLARALYDVLGGLYSEEPVEKAINPRERAASRGYSVPPISEGK
jgi:hypothetical protein